MQVTGNGAEDILAHGTHGVAGQVGLEDLNALLHGLGGYQHLRNEDLVGLELSANNVHSADHALLKNIRSGDTSVQSFLNETLNEFRFAVLYSFCYILNCCHCYIPPKIIQ